MINKSNEEIREEIEAFNAKRNGLKQMFNKALYKHCTQPYYSLLDNMHNFYDKLEQYRDRKISQQGYEYSHRLETYVLVQKFAYCGAVNMLDPLMLATWEDVYYPFMEAYIGLMGDRNAANRQYNERKKADITLYSLDTDTLSWTEATVAFTNENNLHFDDEVMETFQAVLRGFTQKERNIFDELSAHPEMTHREIAQMIGMGETSLSKIYQSIKQKFAEAGFIK